MSKRVKDDSSSSEDEACLEALKEAADQDFLKNSYFSDEKLPENDLKSNKIVTKDKNETSSKVEVDNSHEFENHGLSQSCRDYIAKKLCERLEGEIAVDDENTSEGKRQSKSEQLKGIKLLHSSSTVLTNIVNPDESKTEVKRKKPSCKYNEKDHLKKCKEVAVDPEKIVSKEETKFWSDRKNSEPLKYKKLKNGTLLKAE